MIRTSVTALMILAAGVLSAAGTAEGSPACVETLLCDAVKPEEAALFDKYFGSAMAPVEKGWDSETLTEYSSSWGYNEARKPVLREHIMQLSEDGCTLRYLSCVRFRDSDGRRVNYKERVQHAVLPYVFMSNLVDIVDFNDERVYFDIVKFNSQTRQIEGIEQKSWSRRELKPSRDPLSDDEKALFDELFPTTKLRRTPVSWDAERRVIYSAQGWSRGNLYELKGILKTVAADGSSCRIAHKALERSGNFKATWRPSAYSPHMVVPFVFVQLGEYLELHIEKFHPQTGDYLGSRTLYYYFRSLEPAMEKETLLSTEQ